MNCNYRKVSIVIPVYSKVQKVRKCIENVLKYKNEEINKIIIVNNLINDQELTEYLQHNKEQITCISNDNITGFFISVNIGIEQEKKDDIIILHEETVVTEQWVKKLQNCAYSNNEIATVSPLTNANGIFSIPKYNQANEIPSNYSVESFAEFVEYYSMRQYPIVPYTLGYCMYIKRQVLDELNKFSLDSAADKEMCFQAVQLGYFNALCDDTFVYSTCDQNIENNGIQNSLENKYRDMYDNYINPYYIRLSNHMINENIEMWLQINQYKTRKNLLYFLLADFQDDASNNIGGTQLHVKDLVMNLKEVYNIYVLARDGEYLRMTAWIGNTKMDYLFFIGTLPLYNIYYSEVLKKIYENILRSFLIDIVHIHHTWGLSLDIYYAASEQNIPVILSVHDYYYACPVLRLTNKNGGVCTAKQSTEYCAECIKNEKNVNDQVSYITKWRYENNEVFKLCDSIIFPSKYAADIMKSFYPVIKEKKIRIIEHGVEVNDVPENPVPYIHNHDRLRIAFIGGISQVKGADLIYELITKADSESYQWYIMGGIGVSNLFLLEKDNLIKTGWYKKEDIGQMLHENEIDIVCILSIIGETFCYTLSEAIAANIPVIAKNVGALGSRMQEMNCGWLINKDAEYREVIELLDEIKNDEQKYIHQWNNTKNMNVCHITDMIRSYGKVYDEYNKKNKKEVNIEEVRVIFNAFKQRKNQYNSENLFDEETKRELENAKNELTNLYQSILVRLAVKMRKWNFPGKERLKKIIKSLIRYK